MNHKGGLITYIYLNKKKILHRMLLELLISALRNELIHDMTFQFPRNIQVMIHHSWIKTEYHLKPYAQFRYILKTEVLSTYLNDKRKHQLSVSFIGIYILFNQKVLASSNTTFDLSTHLI